MIIYILYAFASDFVYFCKSHLSSDSSSLHSQFGLASAGELACTVLKQTMLSFSLFFAQHEIFRFLFSSLRMLQNILLFQPVITAPRALLDHFFPPFFRLLQTRYVKVRSNAQSNVGSFSFQEFGVFAGLLIEMVFDVMC